MAELGESVAVAEIDTDNWECPFSHDKPGSVDNELDTDPGKLGTRMGNGTSTRLWDDSSGNVTAAKNTVSSQAASEAIPEPYEVYVALDHLGNSVFLPFSVAAHHLIPGEASLPKSSLINYVKGGKIISSDIGYGVNGRENGIWLPTHHALSGNMPILPFATEPYSYAELTPEGGGVVASFTSTYTQAVMKYAGCQFHDDHTKATDYSKFVIKVLNKIQANLATIKNFNCRKCMDAKAGGGKLPPPYTLVHRLNSVSERLAALLVGSAVAWRPPVYTSKHANAAADAERHLFVRGRL
jgi:A nuclease family of the HNH/ENDO VII superfamily with conserved AHH